MTIAGNIKGISRVLLAEMESWFEHKLPKSQILDSELAEAMARITGLLGREIAIYINRRGRVVNISVGSGDQVSLEADCGRRGEGRPSGIRCIHTHPRGSGALSDVDFSALAMLCLDCIAALGVNEKGLITDIGLSWLAPLEENQEEQTVYPELQAFLDVDFSQKIKDLDKGWKREELYLNHDEDRERAILVALTLGRDESEAESSLDELEALAQTAGVEVTEKLIQKRERPAAATYIGSGKAAEINMLAQVDDAGLIIFDDEISPAQMSNLGNITGRKIIDRSMLILDIFAQRAQSNEGKLQVELAQLRYLLPRLTGQGLALSRLGGGIGTRGPGETKLETDRRKLRRRIADLEQRLEAVEKTAQLHRHKRSQASLPLVALVGYTNAGKSSLLNTLTNEQTLVEDKLFATLDPLTRKVALPDGGSFLLSDTVGFIRKLPHHLIAAFRSTLAEVRQADLILHVVDGSSADAQEQALAVMSVIKELDVLDKPRITVINKIDLIENLPMLERLSGLWPDSITVSALERIGLPQLLEKIAEFLPEAWEEFCAILPFEAGALISLIHEEGKVLEQEYTGQGISIKAHVPKRLEGILSEKIINCHDN